jgi:hypothetical protein
MCRQVLKQLSDGVIGLIVPEISKAICFRPGATYAFVVYIKAGAVEHKPLKGAVRKIENIPCPHSEKFLEIPLFDMLEVCHGHEFTIPTSARSSSPQRLTPGFLCLSHAARLEVVPFPVCSRCGRWGAGLGDFKDNSKGKGSGRRRPHHMSLSFT